MNYKDKYIYIREHFPKEWYDSYNKALDIVDAKTSMFCVCGKLATGLHTNRCSKFQKEVQKEQVRMLEHLIPKEHE